MPDFKPTGTCFDDALDFFCRVAPDMRHVHRLVHAICQAPGDITTRAPGELFAHAWVEAALATGTFCIEGVIADGVRAYRMIPILQLYDRFIVVETARYTFAEADAENERHDTFGPWIPRYLALAKPRPA